MSYPQDWTPTTQQYVQTTIANAANVPLNNVILKSVKAGSIIVEYNIIGFLTIETANNAAYEINQIMFIAYYEPYTITTIIVPPPIISNICFPAGTEINTDQGIIAIEKLEPNKNTIKGKYILYITRTVTIDKYLICLEKDSIGKNYPSKATIMSKDHQIMYKDQLIPAYRFLNLPKNVVKKVKYSGEMLYNVLLEEEGLMEVNNLVCETLHPENIIAKLYRSRIGDEYKSNIIVMMNEALERRDLEKYKKINNIIKHI